MQVGKRMKINDDWRIGCIFCATMEFVDYGRIWCPTSVSSWRCTTLIVLLHIERLLRYDVSYVETLQNVCYDVILYNVGCAVTSPTYVTSWRRQRSLHRDIAYVRYIVTWRRSMPSNLMWSCDVKLSAKRDDVENVLSQSTIRRKRRHKADVRTSLSNRLSMRRKHHFDCQYFTSF